MECFLDLGTGCNRLVFGSHFFELILSDEFLSVYESEEESIVLLGLMLCGIMMGSTVSVQSALSIIAMLTSSYRIDKMGNDHPWVYRRVFTPHNRLASKQQ